MTRWCGILIVALWVALSPSAEAQDKIVSKGRTLASSWEWLLPWPSWPMYSRIVEKRSITGCVIPADNGMSMTDEKDNRSYPLSGNTGDINRAIA